MPSLLTILPFVALIACGADDPAPATAAPAAPAVAAPEGKAGEVDVAGLKAAMDAGSVRLIDVRTPAEYADARVPGAVNIPLDQLESRLADVADDKAAEVYLICAVGGRSKRATKALAQAGFQRPINVAGGTNGWKAAGLPVESGPPTTGDAKVE